MSADSETATENLKQAEGKQTGPKTESGKDVCRRNALKHGAYAETVVFGNCKGEDCKLHQMEVCSFYRNGSVNRSQICQYKVEHLRDRKKSLLEDGPNAAKEGVGMLAALQENTILQAHGAIEEDGVMTEEVIGMDKDGNEIRKRGLHSALDYTRRATKDTTEILKDLTGFDKSPTEDGGFAVRDVIRALEEEDNAG
jgi:hypothetical protein